MANVTQTIPNYLPGVTRIPDFNKLPGQVRDLLNGYPDITYGLLKRPGSQFLWNGRPDINDIVRGFSKMFFHVIDREGDPLFLVCIDSEASFGSATENVIFIYNLETGEQVPVEVNNPVRPTQPFIYLRKDDTDTGGFEGARRGWGPERFSLVSDDKRTVVVNRTQRSFVKKGSSNKWQNQDEPFEWASKKYRTVGNIGALPDSGVKRIAEVTKDGGGGPQDYIKPENRLRRGWNILGTSNDSSFNSGSGLTVRCYIRGEEDGDQAGKISSNHPVTVVSPGFGYYDGQLLEVVGVPSSEICVTTGLEVGKVYHVTGPTNSEGNTDDSDDYYMMPLASEEKTLADDTIEYEGFFWVEAPQPLSRIGLDPTLLPHELVYTGNKFLWQPIDYANRWVGNNDTNPDPSFVDQFIESAFFYNNRLGFLSKDKVILSRPIVYTDESDKDPGDSQDITLPSNNPYVKRNPREVDFYLQSSIQANDGDPIDIAAANNKTSTFNTALSTPQGVVLFGTNSQSILTAPEGGPLTPGTATITNLATYECDPYVNAVAMDSDYYFIDQSNRSCRLHRMKTNFSSAPATIDNLSKIVQDWVPTKITGLCTARAAGLIILYRRDRSTAYIFKTEGELQAWFKWKLPSNIYHIYSKNDKIYFVTQGPGFVITEANMFSLPDVEIMEGTPNYMGPIISPHLDNYYIPDPSDITVTGNETIVTIPDDVFLPGSRITAVTANASLQRVDIRSVGFQASGHVSTISERDQKVLTFPSSFAGEEDRMVIGVPYDFEVEFPTFYFQNQNGADYTAYLTISRAKFAMSLSGDFDFLIKAGVSGANTLWSDATVIPETFTDANLYLSDTATMDFSKVIYIPIHQRNSNFLLKMTSNSPYPLSLDSCMWEGIYSPRYYRRA